MAFPRSLRIVRDQAQNAEAVAAAAASGEPVPHVRDATTLLQFIQASGGDSISKKNALQVPSLVRALDIYARTISVFPLREKIGRVLPKIQKQATSDSPMADQEAANLWSKLYKSVSNDIDNWGGRSKASAEIVGLLKKGSAYYAPSASVVKMVDAIAGKTDEVLPVAAWCTGQYGIDGVYVGVPARLGPRGVAEIVELDLSADELAALRAAAEAIRAKCADLAGI